MPRDLKKEETLIYGPVASRRLGRSLGVDIVPSKTCTYDCVYCQIGRTPQATLVRKPYIEAGRIVSELENRLAGGAAPDFITLGGSGEPCLNSEIGKVIRQVKQVSDVPVAVLTNGSLLWIADVRAGLSGADVVLPSLDAYDEESFQKINRPHPDIGFETMVRGLSDFRKAYTGKIWLEIFIIGGINDTPEAMAAFRDHLAAIGPDRVHINTAVRPPAEDFVRRVPPEKLRRLAAALGPRAEVIAGFKETGPARHEKKMTQEILAMLSRRPCTVADIAAGLGLPEASVARQMAELADSGLVQNRPSGGRLYYFRAAEDRPL